MIESAIKFVKGIFAYDCSGHDYYHTMRVYRLAMQIAEQENADMLIVRLAALLHDVDDVKLSPETHETKRNAVRFMKNSGVDDKVIASVCKIIDEVSFAGIPIDHSFLKYKKELVEYGYQNGKISMKGQTNYF